MELLQLRYFEAVAKTGNMTKAARQLHVAQPAVSQSIARLESELGVKLFTRTGKHIQLNECGSLLINRLPGILSALDNITYSLSNMSAVENSNLHINVLAASALIPRIIASFRHEYPGVNFSLMNNFEVKNFDFYISGANATGFDRSGTVLLKEDILLAVPYSMPLAQRDTVTLSELYEAVFVMTNKGSSLRSVTDFYCERAGLNPIVAATSDDPYTVRELVSAGVGVSFWPELSWGSISSPYIKFLRISGCDMQQIIYMTPGEGTEPVGAALIFRDFTVRYFQNLATALTERRR
ncbi:MAG: LysR family transcriptional regulator [Clostridiales bacterium]|nr:LysR family transcriptional regulator [Clostridiales bacterium]